VLALVLARWLGPPVQRVLFPSTLGWNPEPLDLRVGVIAFALAQLVGLCVSGAMVWRTRSRDVGSLLRGGAATRNRRSARARTVLVGLQAGVSFLLLVASLAFVRSFHKATHVDLGYTLDELVSVQIATGSLELTRLQERDLYRELYREVSALPGVASASLAYTNPWWNNRTETVFSVDRDSMPPVPGYGDPLFDAASPDYLRTMGVEVREGRWISADDRPGSEPVMVVNEALAKFYWPGERAIGHCLRLGADTMPCRTIVGISRDQRVTGTLDGPPVPGYVIPMAQADEHGLSPSLFVRPTGSASPLLPVLRRAAQTIMPGLPYAGVERVRDHLEPMLAPWRLGAIAFTALGVVAMVVALAGLYAVLAFIVAERRHEFAVRAAIGGSHRQIARPVTRQALVTVLGGLASGAVVLALAARRLETFLFQVTVLDPLPLLAISITVLFLAWRASAGPARVAARQDPMEALRSD
jgi:predicted permease